jgi:hypothetical protein
VLHALDILIHEDSLAVTSGGVTALQVAGVGYDFDREFFLIHLDQPLVPNQTVTFSIKFVRYLAE